jgi:parvulin-like peptidyl-prolyl isomerase
MPAASLMFLALAGSTSFVSPWHTPAPRVLTMGTPVKGRAAAMAGIFDDLIGAAKEQLREVRVQHILVDSQLAAREIFDAIEAEGASPYVVGQYASAKSTCGSAKKRPDAKLQMLRGDPGELRFRRGSMAPEFEEAAFSAAPGTLVRPFKTQFGWHVMYIHEE